MTSSSAPKRSSKRSSAPAKDAPVLVTGAAGHLGANLVHELVRSKTPVRVLLRRGENNEAVEGLDVEIAYGDLRDSSTLKPAIEGTRAIYHVASMVSTIDGDANHRRTMFETNVLGTRRLLRLAKEAGVERTIVTGSFSAVGYDLDDTAKPADEVMAFYPYHRAMPYERSKVLQEMEVLKAVANGQDAMIVTSCALVGGHDYWPSRMGRTMARFANGEINAYVPGGFPFVAAKDIVSGHTLAMDHGRAGQKYIIATKFMNLDDIFAIFEKLTGVKRPKYRIPTALMLPAAEVASFLMTRFRPKATQLLTPGAIRRLKLCRHADTRKAQTELGFVPSSLEDAFADAYAFHWARGAIKNPDALPPRLSVVTPATSQPSIPIHA